ncbi:SUMF1/EgtB/PvdO family nonheme iron enzyme [Rhodovulum steppense]|uniref:Putative caspase-like protein n=1 Tax=Rhodovulum steppense TaxID=540251 RepID=A0A4R1YVM8_9RHOB|nr:SUMF1/EgtB/PvdO family nonheme iron enzyme [Rhodovulum steppense]TCM85198.1 putative caspase-like protein [Rhodovulum steppense]
MRIIVGIVILFLAALPGRAERRVALVVGNGAYAMAPALPNPGNDAEAVAAALERIGFEVERGLDLDGAAMRARIRDFGRQAEGADLALFFYAGHGIQMAGRNYLIPTDAALEREGDLDLYAMPLDLVIAEMERSAKTNIVLLDACRDNPFETQLSRAMGQARSTALLGRGLAPVETAGGLFVGFATDPGRVAFDGAGRHSPFTEAVLDHVATAGLEINAMMTRVRADVFETTAGRQRPWSTSSLLREVYLSPAAPPPADDTAQDIAMWQGLGEAAGEEALRAYLDAFPHGLFAEVARDRLGAIELAALLPERGALTSSDPPLEPAPAPVAVDPTRECEFCPTMVRVSGGATVLGSPDPQAPAAERPATPQTLAPFLMAEHEVSVGLVRRYEAETGHTIPRGCYVWTADGRMRMDRAAYWRAPGYDVTDASPAACLNWEDAMRITAWLNEQAPGAGYRLPSEAEFEFALKAGGDGPYPWDGGAENACGHANAADASSRFRWRNTACDDGAPDIAMRGSFPQNAYGLFDLAGNLWEWTADCWNDSHRGAAADGSARTEGLCSSRVLRGGSWDDPLANLRVTYRVGIPAAQRQANVGMRVVRPAP